MLGYPTAQTMWTAFVHVYASRFHPPLQIKRGARGANRKREWSFQQTRYVHKETTVAAWGIIVGARVHLRMVTIAVCATGFGGAVVESDFEKSSWSQSQS